MAKAAGSGGTSALCEMGVMVRYCSLGNMYGAGAVCVHACMLVFELPTAAMPQHRQAAALAAELDVTCMLTEIPLCNACVLHLHQAEAVRVHVYRYTKQHPPHITQEYPANSRGMDYCVTADRQRTPAHRCG